MALKRIKDIYIYTCLLIITFSLLYFGYLLFIDGEYVNVPITTNNFVVQTEHDVYKSGDAVAVKWNYCKGTNIPSDISINLVDGILYTLPVTQSTRLKGCYNNYTVIASIPKAVPPGNYHLTANIHFKVNGIKDINYQAISNFFTIK